MRPSGIFFGVPALPASYVPRPEASEPLLEQLLARLDTGPEVSAIYEQGGPSKTTMAAALAREPRSAPRPAGRDTLGHPGPAARAPALAGRLNGGPGPPGPASPGSSTLFVPAHQCMGCPRRTCATCWRSGRCCWCWMTPGQSSRCGPSWSAARAARILLTTRQAALADTLQAHRRNLAMLRPAQALALLERRIGRKLAGGEQEHALAVAEAVDYLPLALELAAARVAAPHPNPLGRTANGTAARGDTDRGAGGSCPRP